MADRDTAKNNPDLPSKGPARDAVLDSYQGRYLVLATLLVLALLAIAWLGHSYVTEVTGTLVARLEKRTNLQEQLLQGMRELQNIEKWLHRQLIEPGLRQKASLEEQIRRLRTKLTDLQRQLPEGEQKALLEAVLQTRLNRFAADAERFLRISHDNRLRFPSTEIMQTRMRDKAATFTEIITDVLDELRDQHDGNTELLLDSYRLHDTWQKILSEFRLLVANRFGVFADDPMAGMQARAGNIEIYMAHLQHELKRLEKMPTPEGTLYLGPETWQQLSRIADAWHREYLQIWKGLTSENWRRDLQIYNDSLEPQLTRLQADLGQIQASLNQESAGEIKELASVAERLTQAIFIVTLADILLIFGAYLYLRTRILKPISATTQALRQEAAGITHNRIPIPKLRETRDLVSAFAEMRREVWRRQRGLDYLAHHDPLTQLPNRILFKDRLEHAIRMAQRNNQMVALLFLDLDNFKQINDTLGHLAGDELLVTVARRLKNLLRSSDTVARLGGDEFAILLENIEGKRQARNAASKILSALSEPVKLAGHDFHLTASIGIAIAPYDDSQPDNLIRDADSAMYEAKRLGKNAYFFFSSELLERATTQLNLEREIRTALEKEEFLFHFQPIVHTRSKKIYGVEALIRWQPEKGPLRYPDEFVETLLAIDNRQDFMEKLLCQIDELQQKCIDELQVQLPVAINLSASVLRNATQHNLVLNSLKRRRYPELLRIEITEDTLLEDLANAHVLLTEIRRLGIPLVLDDFGTGQSSLNHLRSFPFDAIKIDKEFVMNLDKNPEDANLVKAVTQLAHSFNMKVVAEGVETENHRHYLRKIGCDYLQGYLISKPISSDRLFAMLEHIRSRLKVVN